MILSLHIQLFSFLILRLKTIPIAVSITITVFSIAILAISTSLYIGTVQDCTQELAARLLDLIKRLLDQSTRCGTSTYNQNCAVAQRSDKRSI